MKKRLYSGFLILAVLVPLCGGGKKDAGVLERADALIAEKQYNRAMALLSGYVKSNNDNFDAAQTRIRKILKVREDYNLLAQRLLGVMENDPDNARLILSLSEQLMELDPERIAETQDLIARIRNLALFRYNRSRLEAILDEGDVLTAGRRYPDAMRVYAGGLDIYRDEFFNAGLGERIENRAREEIAALNSGIPALAALIGTLDANLAALESLQNQNLNRQNFNAYNAAYNRLGETLDQLAALRTAYSGADSFFEEQFVLMRERNPDSGDRTFPAFAIRLLEGREESGGGMLGVFDTAWNRAVSRTVSLITEKSAAAYGAVYGTAINQEYDSLDRRLEMLASYGALPMNLLERWGRYGEESPRDAVLDARVPTVRAGDYAERGAELAVIERYRALGALGTRFLSLRPRDSLEDWKNGGNAEVLINRERNLVAAVRQMKGEAAALNRALEDDAAEYAPYQRRYGGRIISPFTDFQRTLAALESLMNDQENAALARQYTMDNALVESRLVRREQELSRGQSLVRDSKRPSQVQPLFASLDESVNADLRAADALVSRYEEEGSLSPELNALYSAAVSAKNRLESARVQGLNSSAEARSLSGQAQNHVRSGDRFYADARAALGREEFEFARNRVLQAGEQYDSALIIEDSASVRQVRDVLLPQLDRDIARLENEAVVRDVGEALVQARAAFYQGDLDRSEDLLTGARNRWRVTQTEDNQEVTAWLNIVRGALLSRSGRTIPPTAPLYAEMSQLLSEARKNYNEGLYYLGTSRRTDGLVRFSSAREKTQKVRLLYPLNEDAGLLELRMDRETDPAVFDASFNIRLQNARAGTRQGSWQSYADLQNLFLINPNYPGRNAIIYEAEIAMGIRPPPPDPQKIAASQSLTQEARAIINANPGSEIQLRRALGLCNQALAANPENTEAARLASRIYILIGGQSSVFDHDTEQKYQRAVELLQRNYVIEAYSLAQEIGADRRYSNNSRLIDLLQRIRANL